MHFNEHTCSSSRAFVFRAAGCSTTSFMAWQSVHKAVAVVCVLDEILAVVLEVTIAGITAVVGSDVAVAMGSPGRETRGWRG